MNLIEAIKTGRRIKRKCQKEWYSERLPNDTWFLVVEDLMAEDWEAEPEEYSLAGLVIYALHTPDGVGSGVQIGIETPNSKPLPDLIGKNVEIKIIVKD